MKELSYFNLSKMGTIFKSWSVLRLARLALAVVAFSMSISQHEPMFAALGSILLLQSVFNLSCCAGGACAAPPPRKSYKRTTTNSQDSMAHIEEVK